MIQKIKKISNLISNMGARYLFFRIFYTIKAKLGWQKKAFPTNPDFKTYISLKEWSENIPPFFFYGKNSLKLPKQQTEALANTFQDIENGIFTFFNKSKLTIGTEYNWLVNPSTGYRYNSNKHWSEIQDLSTEAGDIKYVWEKARFSYIYDIIRYDYHYNEDKSAFVFSEIESFIDKNPINQGPNYKCSQEISLRTLNWTFALYYYKDSPHLTEALFSKIMHTIYWQIHHVYHNINFSRITVRNNHAITETLMLYLSAKLFPFLPNVQKWSKHGKKWFEQEIAYQIYEDGTFLQFSMNYHRVVVQLLTWAIQLAKLNGEQFNPKVYERAQKSLDFLDNCTDPVSGKLPNYGSNDGALFFKLTNDDYRIYTSQLDDLRAVLNGYTYNESESAHWYGIQPETKAYQTPDTLNSYTKGGYYIMQDGNTKTFIRCGKYKDRPFQSDNLHIDIWANGINYLRDNGSYKYNTSQEELNYFNGCEGHNTVSVGKADQMLKGGRFIWYYWVKKAKASLQKKANTYEFDGNIKAFAQLGNNIVHRRKVTKIATENRWEIQDIVQNKKEHALYQYWHVHPDHFDKVNISTKDDQGNELKPLVEETWFSGYYGIKEKSLRITFTTERSNMTTSIQINT
ncbi:heparin-sulfate lyase [Kordia sp. SMS9]|uniref:alginate lyase family protein n=1 Tax=Kordia sp. SMS9 TaxID=2282170 RepID=UPI000E0D3A04|nr:alginate lyase family protein [Kordia sp. SMS9]AXG68976.1 heparin-sulfate lyase [Kordia sp. SMS9]